MHYDITVGFYKKCDNFVVWFQNCDTISLLHCFNFVKCRFFKWIPLFSRNKWYTCRTFGLNIFVSTFITANKWTDQTKRNKVRNLCRVIYWNDCKSREPMCVFGRFYALNRSRVLIVYGLGKNICCIQQNFTFQKVKYYEGKD